MKNFSGIILFAVTMFFASIATQAQDIYDAISNGDLVLVKDILEANPELLNEKNADANTPLNLACFERQAGIVEYLLDKGADPYLGDNENSMPIHLAAISGSIESLDLLLDHGVDIDIQDDNGMTPLLFAVSRRQVDMADYLIDKGADADLQSITGWSVVHLSIATRNNDLARKLISGGAEVNTALETGATPLHSASSFGNTEMVKLLVEYGADIDAETEHGEQAVSWALNSNTLEVLKFLVENGADLKHRNNHGANILHNAAGRGNNYDNISYVLDKGLDINSQDDFGRTPLFFAAWSNDPDGMSKFLIMNGAEVNPSNCMDKKTCACFPNFSTPLHAAVRHGHLAMAKNLVNSGAKINIYNDEGMSPLHCAIDNGNLELVSYLIDNGAFLNVGDQNQGSTELHMAVARGYNDIVELLLASGADIEATDNCGKTAFDYAMYYKHKPMAYELLAEGSDDEKLQDYLSCPGELAEDIAYGDAKVWFLGHSGWAIRTQNHFLVFDYFTSHWDRSPDDSCLASGFIIPEEIKDMNVTVFSTHAHGDHYWPGIFEWKESIPDIEYVLCWNQNTEGNDYTLIPVHEEQEVEDMDVYVHHSTDLGGGYLIDVDGLTILHMGDHANGEDGLMAEFTDEIDIIEGMNKDIDILFGGIRGCSLGEPEQVKQGLYYTLEHLQPELFIPMHAGGHSFSYKRFVEQAKEDGFEDIEMKYVIHKGDRFMYSKEAKEGVSSL